MFDRREVIVVWQLSSSRYFLLASVVQLFCNTLQPRNFIYGKIEVTSLTVH